MYRLLRPLLFLLPPELAHELGVWALRILGWLRPAAKALRRRALRPSPELAVEVAGLKFEHPIGLAAGLDKNAVAVEGLFALGFSFVEVGTLTPRPQPGNPRPRIFRLPEERALINRLGFNNHGAARAADQLARVRWRPGPVGINLGKNKDTELSAAAQDYVRGVEELGPYADYLVVNASSPNTPSLRKLQDPELLEALLSTVRERILRLPHPKPLFLKIAPDLDPDAVDAIVDVAMRCRVDALIATNTTIARPLSHPLASEAGGLSGAPLRAMSNDIIRRAYARSAGKLPIIGVGGVLSVDDAYEKIRAGATLVQVYTGLIYRGPGMVSELVRGLRARFVRDGVRLGSDAVGRHAVR